jgi:IS1 family transposase
MAIMNRLSTAERAKVLAVLVEGNGLRATARITGVARMTVEKLFRDLGTVCASYQDATLRNLPCKRLQCDEIWAFCYAKAKNVPAEKRGQFGYGDIWTWTAIDADTKLVPSWLVSTRDAGAAYGFMMDLASRLRRRVQLTTDAHRAYLYAVEGAFGADIDYATLQKLYGTDPGAEKRYSPARIIGMQAAVISGDPDDKHISTSYVERQNLTMRMHMRRFTRLTNGFSKKAENHAHMVALYTVFYNWTKIHTTLRVTPAMAAGLADRVFDISDIVALIEQAEAQQPAGLSESHSA